MTEKWIKRGFLLLLLLFIAFNTFSEEHYTGKMLIMGWEFEDSDTSLQTNLAIDALLKYVEAAKNQMSAEERYNPSCRIELYESTRAYNSSSACVFIYINIKDEDDYDDRYIEIDFYNVRGAYAEKYKLVLGCNGSQWSQDIDEKNTWDRISRNEPAYNFFVSWVERLRR